MKRSFTLIELLIVLVIIGVITALAVPKFERMILKSRMMTRVPVLEQMRLAEINYKNETGQYYIDAMWREPGDPGIVGLKAALGIDIPYISDYQNQPSSFVVLQEGTNLSIWFNGDPRFDGKYAYVSYASQGLEALGDACVIMCYDADLNVKKLSIKYSASSGSATGTGWPVDDIVVKK